ncbi:hypothetical protein LCGC14_2777610 [marine sediment metagenome]|uniref:Uncharacterized protein n=1 Tax=marine sediment metagenome TaxID=412755 RepID=A0A0F8YU87_9ZZZZ
MSKDFSDAPLTVNGVTVKPTWLWSKRYRAEVAESMRQNGKSHLRTGEADQLYVEWYADQHGLTETEARRRIEGMA